MDTSINNGRREFLRKTFLSCAVSCLAAPAVIGKDSISRIALDQQHKFQSDAGMTMQEVYDFAFTKWYIPSMKNLMAQIGKEKFLTMLKKSGEMMNEPDRNVSVDYEERTLLAYADFFKQRAASYYKLRNTFEIIRSDEHVFQMKCTECLWAKTFREAGAADIGYACSCYRDYSSIKAYNPKMTLIREKTLMQGNDCCDFKIVMES